MEASNLRRKVKSMNRAKEKGLLYLISLLALAIYGIPHIPQIHPGISGTFSFLWIMLTALVIAANLYFLVGADQERSRMLDEKAVVWTQPAQDGHRQRRRAY